MNTSLLAAPNRNRAPTVTDKRLVSILVVDDNPAKRLAIKAVLLPLGYPIVEADSGFAALRCITAQNFAVILLDVRMPVMDGFETAGLIRQRQQSEMTPIIFITAQGKDEIVTTDLYAEGAVDFIFSPVPPQELRAKVSVFVNLFIKAEALAARAREVQTSADHLRLLTDAAPIGIFQTDAQNRYAYTNPRWTEITGITSDEAAGQKWDTIIGSEQRAGVIAELAQGEDRGDLCHRFEIRLADSPSRIVLVTSKAVPDSKGGTAGWVGTLADITAEAGAEAAMSAARDEATEASRLKSDFLANMSHEIRTPMNGVIGMTDLLLETNLDARQRDYAETVRTSGETLLTIINDILDFSKIEAGKLEIEDIEFNLQATVNDVVDLLAGPAQAKGLELVAVIESSVPAVVSGDPGRVRQVLINLIGNAIKFTQAGEVVVRVKEPQVPGADSVVRFEVSDTGDGIGPEKLATIFQPFVQADTSTSRKYGGTGLGLAISGQLVSLMGGDCGVSSTVGEGSTFWFTIRVHTGARQAAPVLLSADAGFAGVTALIVDDNATQRSVLSGYLTDWGMNVTTAGSGEAALATLRTAAGQGRPFAVALLDRSMPGMDGLELKDAIVDDPALTARLVLMTGLGDRDLGNGAASGVSGTLSKPVHREDLLESLQVALRLQVANVAPTETTEEGPSATGEPELTRLLLAEDNLINQKVAVAMLSSAGYQVDTVLNGAAALQALDAQEYGAILMDCQMPEMNGYEATVAIRAREGSGPRIPIIALTAGARPEDRALCLEAGMDRYLSKPVSKDALLAVVAQCVESGAARTAAPLRVDHASGADSTIDSAVFEGLRALDEAGAQNFLTDLVAQFVQDTEPLLDQLHETLEAGDALAVSRIADNLEESGAQLGGWRLALSCGRLSRKATTGSLSDDQVDLHAVEIDYRELRKGLKQKLLALDEQPPSIPVQTNAAPTPAQSDSPPTHSGGEAQPALDAKIVGRLTRLGEAAGDDFMQRLATLFLAESGARLVELREALAADDADAIAGLAHTLRGGSASVGATGLADVCATLEADGAAGDLVGAATALEAVEAELVRVRTALGSPTPTP